MSFLWLQNSIDHTVSQIKCFIIYRTTAANKFYVLCRIIEKGQVVKLKIHVLQLLNV